jgi:histidinol phosphatase-like enzyme
MQAKAIFLDRDGVINKEKTIFTNKKILNLLTVYLRLVNIFKKSVTN